MTQQPAPLDDVDEAMFYVKATLNEIEERESAGESSDQEWEALAITIKKWEFSLMLLGFPPSRLPDTRPTPPVGELTKEEA